MADCLISPVQEIGKSILTECVWPPIKSHFDYWWCFDNNIEGLKDYCFGLVLKNGWKTIGMQVDLQKGMEDLNLLSFQSISIRSLPPTLGSIENLQTLRLFRFQVENISVIGELTSLKILSCCECENITELPAEIGRLKGLRLLELNGCSILQRIPFGIISCLFLLEELKIGRSFSEWETGGERGNALLTEMERLRNLTCLEIEISDCTSSAQETRLSQKLCSRKLDSATCKEC